MLLILGETTGRPATPEKGTSMNRPAVEPAAVLRRRAEAQIAKGDLPSKVNLDPVRLLHELQVHQIELELQNEELVAANRELDVLRRHYETLYQHAPVGYLRLTLDGVVMGANQRAFEMLKRTEEALAGRPMRDCFAPESVQAFDALLASSSRDGADVFADNLLVHRPLSVSIFTKVQCRKVDFDDLQPQVILVAVMDVSALKFAMDDVISSLKG